MFSTREPQWLGFEPLEARQLLATISWDGEAGDLSWHTQGQAAKRWR